MRLLTGICVGLLAALSGTAQDTIRFHGQPTFETGMNIADRVVFFEETNGDTLTLQQVKTKPFVPFRGKLREVSTSKRPNLIQWLKFTISNTHPKDTVRMLISPTPHYFIWLYDETHLLARGGAYYKGPSVFDRFSMPVSIGPGESKTYYLRTLERARHLLPPSITLDTPYSFWSSTAKYNYASRYLFLGLAVMTGCLLFITLFATYHYYLFRERYTLRYMLYGFFSFVTGLFWMDIRFQVQLFDSFTRDIMFSTFVFVIPTLYGQFIGSMLELKKQFPKAWTVMTGLMGITTVQAIIAFMAVRFGWFFLKEDLYHFFSTIVPVMLLNIGLLILTFMSKSPVKWFLFAGLISLILLLCLPVTGIFSYYSDAVEELTLVLNFIPFFILLGVTIEAVCFSFALSYKSKLVLDERNRMQEYYALDLKQELEKRTLELQEQGKISEEQKIKHVQLAFEQRIAETEMVALRAQMNPHFIFNCLNSIKLYTLENDSRSASEYLTIFSQLIRLVLENSQSEKITLKKELETLRLYIELEAMRFKSKVNYEINVSPDIDQQYIEIPPLLLQPYVENAIWHGLMHKKMGGNITINVSHPTEHLLDIEIVDDGIGREMAAQYKSKSATRNKSFGLKMTSERLQVIQQRYQVETNVTINDLKDDLNNPVGTKVVIRIPL